MKRDPGASFTGRSPKVGWSTNAPDLEGASAWFALARGDLGLAERLATSDDPAALRGAATYAQQAAEKALKAAIALTGREPPRTHDLAALVDACSATLPAIDLEPLTAALSSGRYPDLDAAPYTVQEAGGLVSDARTIVSAIAAWLEDSGLDVSRIEPA